MHYCSGPSGNKYLTLAAGEFPLNLEFSQQTGNHVSFYWNQCPLHNWWMFSTNTAPLSKNECPLCINNNLWVVGLKSVFAKPTFYKQFYEKKKKKMTDEILGFFSSKWKKEQQRGWLTYWQHIYFSQTLTDKFHPGLLW